MNNLKDFANDAVIKDLALECKQYRELIPRLYDDLAAVKKAHKEALEFNYDLAEENTAVHTKALAMQERIEVLEDDLEATNQIVLQQILELRELEAVAEATAEWFGPSLQDARFETVAIIKALREAGYTYTTQEESK